MKRAAKLTSIVISLIMTLAMLAGCSSAAPTANPTVAPTAAAATSAPAAATSAAAEATPAPVVDSWKVDTTPLTIDWYVAEPDYNSTWDPNVCYAAKIFKERTGVTINFSFPVGGDANEKLNTMIASDSLPDLLGIGQNAIQWPQLEAAGKLQPLNTLIDQYAPGFKTIMYKSMVDWCTYTDGNLYGFPSHFAPIEEIKATGYVLDSGTGMVARKEIMDQLGIVADDFKTQDGMFNALMKVKNANLEYNGQKIIPLYVGYDVVDDIDWYTRESFGVPYENADGTLANKFHSPQYLEMMQYFAKLHNAGLMTDENFTGTYDTQIEKLASGQVFSVIGCMGDFGDGFSSLVANDPNVDIVPVGPLMPSDGTPLACHSSSMVGWIMTAIPTTSKNANRLIAAMNYIYSEEGKFLITVGVEGETLDRKSVV
jgi:putative aldouronate transport system substrate-binding protein